MSNIDIVSVPPNQDVESSFDIALDADALKRTSVRGSMLIAVAQAAKIIMQLGSQIILARLLFPADFGLIAMVYPVIGFLQIFVDLGLAQAIVQRRNLEQSRVSALFWINMSVSALLALLTFAAAPLAAWAYGEPRVTLVMFALGAMIPIAALGVHPAALLTRQMRFGIISLHEIIATLTGIVATVVAALNGWSFWSLIVGQLAVNVVSAALNWARCGWRPSWPAFTRAVWADVRFGGGLTGANLATFATTSGDNILIGITSGQAALGLYDRSYRLVVQPIGQLVAPISRVAVPLLSRLVDQPVQYRLAYLDMFRALLIITAPVMLVCITNGYTIIDVFFGKNWVSAAPIFSWICVGGLTSGIYTSASWLFISQARTTEMMKLLIVAAIINIASFLIGAIGGVVWIAAMGAIVFVLGTTPFVLYGATRTGPLRPNDLVRAVAPVVVQAAITFLILSIERRMGFTGFTQLVIATAISFGTFVMIGLFIPSHRNLVRRVAPLVFSRNS